MGLISLDGPRCFTAGNKKQNIELADNTISRVSITIFGRQIMYQELLE